MNKIDMNFEKQPIPSENHLSMTNINGNNIIDHLYNYHELLIFFLKCWYKGSFFRS